MKNYKELLIKILETGAHKGDRTGVGTISLFGERLQYDLSKGFPLVTGKFTNFKAVHAELEWFLSGSTDRADLDSSIWDAWHSKYTLDRELRAVPPRVRSIEGTNWDTVPDDEGSGAVYDLWVQLFNESMFAPVHPSWHTFATFEQEIKQVPHYHFWIEDPSAYYLDLSYYSSNLYSASTCVFLRKDEGYGDMTIRVMEINGAETYYYSLFDAARAYKVDKHTMRALIEHNDAFTVLDATFRRVLISPTDLGKVYGHNWRNLASGDQIAGLLDLLMSDPDSRRMIVSSWIPESNRTAALDACHALFQTYVTADGRLDLQMYQRSADMFLGVPFNIASYALLVHVLAFLTGLEVGTLTIVFGDCHIYNNHLTQVEQYIERPLLALPELEVTAASTDLKDGFAVSLTGYEHSGVIQASVAV